MKTYILLYLFIIKKFKKNILIENNNNLNSEIITRKKSIKTGGNNDVYPADSKKEFNEYIYNFTKNYNNYKLLKTLENNKVNSLTKISKINDYYKNENSNYMHNLNKGGLLNDWNFDINNKIF